MEAASKPEPGSSRKRTWIRVGLSVAILFHLFVIGIAPNRNTAVGQWVDPVIGRYISALELAANWNFFSPEPGTPVYIEWELENRSGEVYSKGMLPEFESPFAMRERQNRRMTAARFISMSDERLVKVMSTYLCSHSPGVYSIRLWSSYLVIPSPAEIASGKKTKPGMDALSRRLVAHHFCEGHES